MDDRYMVYEFVRLVMAKNDTTSLLEAVEQAKEAVKLLPPMNMEDDPCCMTAKEFSGLQKAVSAAV